MSSPVDVLRPCEFDTDIATLGQICRFLVSEMLSPPGKAKLCKAIGKLMKENEDIRPEHEEMADKLLDLRLLTLKNVYDPFVYNLDAVGKQRVSMAVNTTANTIQLAGNVLMRGWVM